MEQSSLPSQQPIRYAGFWIRLVALCIDGIIIGAIVSLFFKGIGQPPVTTELFSVSQIVTLLVGYIYFAALQSSPWQATVGKRLLGLRVTDARGQRLGFGRATGRYFAKIISAAIVYIGFIMAGFTAKKQGLHDMIAGTLVLKGRATTDNQTA